MPVLTDLPTELLDKLALDSGNYNASKVLASHLTESTKTHLERLGKRYVVVDVFCGRGCDYGMEFIEGEDNLKYYMRYKTDKPSASMHKIDCSVSSDPDDVEFEETVYEITQIYSEHYGKYLVFSTYYKHGYYDVEFIEEDKLREHLIEYFSENDFEDWVKYCGREFGDIQEMIKEKADVDISDLDDSFIYTWLKKNSDYQNWDLDKLIEMAMEMGKYIVEEERGNGIREIIKIRDDMGWNDCLNWVSENYRGPDNDTPYASDSDSESDSDSDDE